LLHDGLVRRALAAALLGISLWIGSLAWTGFLLTSTVLNPERSRNVAEAVYDDEAVRARLAANISGGVDAALPDGVPVDRSAIDAGAERALDSPAVESVFVDAFVRTHQAMLGEGDAPRRLDPGAFGAAGRQSLVEDRPALDAVLPASPEVAVELPTERVPNLGPVRRGLLSAVPILAAASAFGVLLALLVARNRPAVVRRAGFWAVGLSALVLVFAYGIPALAASVVPEQSEVVAALVGAMAAETRVPAITLGALGFAGIVLSLFWRAAPAMLADRVPPSWGRPAPRRQPRLHGGPPRRPSRDIPVPTRPAAPTPPVQRSAPPSPTTIGPTAHDPAPTRVEPAPGGTRPQGRPEGGNTDHTRSEDIPSSSPQQPAATRWVAGVGWVVESAEHIPPEARWVPGVGYVVEDR
jgi:hypothetical protein